MAVTTLAVVFNLIEWLLHHWGLDPVLVCTLRFLSYAMYGTDATVISIGLLHIIRDEIKKLLKPEYSFSEEPAAPAADTVSNLES